MLKYPNNSIMIGLWLLLFFAACAPPPPKPEPTPEVKIEVPKVKPKTGRPYEVFGKTYYPMTVEESVGYVDEGIASWYGKEFHNRPTANGERFNMYNVSAAHTTLPLPIWVRVTNLTNGQSLDVRINDRGPFVDDRLIDLSYGAAVKLGYEKQGVTKVRVETLPQSAIMTAQAEPIEYYRSDSSTSKKAEIQHAPIQNAPWRELSVKDADKWKSDTGKTNDQKLERFIQVGSFGSNENARLIARRLQVIGKAKIIKSSIGARTMYRVRLGPYDTREGAEKIVRALRRMDIDQAQIILD